MPISPYIKLTDMPAYSRQCTLFISFLIAIFCVPFTQAVYANNQACTTSAYCVEENSWQLGIAMGVGGRTNPLVDGDAIPFVILPDIAYYGKHFYFDNAEIGFQFYPSANTSIETFVAPNTEKANFSFWQPSNIFIPAASFTQADSSFELDNDAQISIDDVASRKLAIDAGVRWQWYNQNHHVRATLAGDVSGVYKGTHATLEYRYTFSFAKWRLSISPHVKWFSANLTHYYYGVSNTDTPFNELTYTADSGMQFGLSLNAAYSINEKWQWLARTSVTRLHSGMSDSPLVEDDQIVSAFIGIAYRF